MWYGSERQMKPNPCKNTPIPTIPILGDRTEHVLFGRSVPTGGHAWHAPVKYPLAYEPLVLRFQYLPLPGRLFQRRVSPLPHFLSLMYALSQLL